MLLSPASVSQDIAIQGYSKGKQTFPFKIHYSNPVFHSKIIPNTMGNVLELREDIGKLCLGSWGLQSIRSTGSTRTASAHPGMTSSATFWSGAARKVMTCLELTTFPGVAGRSQISQTAYNCCFSQSS